MICDGRRDEADEVVDGCVAVAARGRVRGEERGPGLISGGMMESW